jgi:hypothetical protein
MGIGNRFTRDRASLFVWGLLALACVVMVLVARTGQHTAYTAEIDDARARGLSYANGVVTEGVSAKPGEPLKGLVDRALFTRLQAEVFVDPTVARVRVWGADGLLLFTTDTRQRSGEIRITDDPGINAAIEGNTFAQSVTQPFTYATTGLEGEVTDLLQTYSPLLVGDRITAAGVVQIDFLLEPLAEASESPWRDLQLAFGFLAVVFVVLTIVSFARRPRVADAAMAAPAARPENGEGPEGIVDEAKVRDELEAAYEQLQQAEEAHRYLENRLKQAQAELAARPPAAPDGPQSIELAIASERRVEAERKAADAEARATRLEAELREAKHGGAAPNGEVAEPEPKQAEADAPAPAEESTRAPSSPAAGSEELARLEERLLAAERRAQEARERVEALTPEERAAEATDLRERLARTAARKRGIESAKDEE